MPRVARKKHSTAVYHVMSRSITEFDMFPEGADKSHFLDILSKCKEKFHCKVYGYCLMTNHYHLHIDSNGFDISNFMKSLNQMYVKYINKKYNRKGHLLAERFNSKIIDSDEYNLMVSSYIHNNAKDIPGYANRVFDYPYSSMGIYMDKIKDGRKLVDTDFVLCSMNETDKARAKASYAEMVAQKRETGINQKLKEYLDEFQKEQFEYKPYREIMLRDMKPEEVIRAIAQKLGIEDIGEIRHRWKRRSMKFRELAAYFLTSLCGMGSREACRYMPNITPSGLASLSWRGFEVFRQDRRMREFLLKNTTKSVES